MACRVVLPSSVIQAIRDKHPAQLESWHAHSSHLKIQASSAPEQCRGYSGSLREEAEKNPELPVFSKKWAGAFICREEVLLLMLFYTVAETAASADMHPDSGFYPSCAFDLSFE